MPHWLAIERLIQILPIHFEVSSEENCLPNAQSCIELLYIDL